MSYEWENPRVLAVNRLPSRTSGFSHPTREGAYEEDPGATLGVSVSWRCALR